MQPGVLLALIAYHAGVALSGQYLGDDLVIVQPQHIGDFLGGVALQIEVVHLPHLFGLLGVRHQDTLVSVVVIPVGYSTAAHPVALLDPLQHTHAGALVNVLAFKLGER